MMILHRLQLNINRVCTTNNGGMIHNEYWLGNDNIYSLDYNTANNNTWDNENDLLL